MNLTQVTGQIVLTVVLVVAATSASIRVGAQSVDIQPLPDTPQVQPQPQAAHKLPAYDRTVWIVIAGAHTADYFLTEDCIHLPMCHEAVLPPWIWRHKTALALTEAGMTAVQIELSRELRRRGHRKLARTWDMVNAIGFVGTAVYVGNVCR